MMSKRLYELGTCVSWMRHASAERNAELLAELDGQPSGIPEAPAKRKRGQSPDCLAAFRGNGILSSADEENVEQVSKEEAQTPIPPPPAEPFYDPNRPATIDDRFSQAVAIISKGVFLPHVPASDRVVKVQSFPTHAALESLV